jgi:hypothetical protein
MNRADEFEEGLRQQPLRPIPSAWRRGILSAAREAASARLSPEVSRPSLLSSLSSRLSALLWPNPKAWAGLGAVWLLVLGLNLASREPGRQAVAQDAMPPSPQLRALLQQQEQLFAELVGPVERTVADRPKPSTPRPHSQRQEEFLRADWIMDSTITS